MRKNHRSIQGHMHQLLDGEGRRLVKGDAFRPSVQTTCVAVIHVDENVGVSEVSMNRIRAGAARAPEELGAAVELQRRARYIWAVRGAARREGGLTTLTLVQR